MSDIETLGHPHRVLYVELFYPRVNPCQIIQIGVRAADDIRVCYDFDRDGWVIQQASIFEWDADDTVMNEDWQEVAFVKAWGRERRGDRAQRAMGE